MEVGTLEVEVLELVNIDSRGPRGDWVGLDSSPLEFSILEDETKAQCTNAR